MEKSNFKIDPKVTAKRIGQPDIIDELHQECETEWERYQEAIPNTLYHYTSALGLLGILSSRSLWFTHIEYFEDRSEVEYGRELFLKIVAELNDESYLPKQKTFIQNILNHFENEWEENKDEIFTVSFCSKEDVLSQWQRFANNGYCLGFNLSGNTYFGYQFSSKYHAVPGLLNQVIYDEEKQNNYIENILKRLLTLLQDVDEVTVEDCESVVYRQIKPRLYYYKNNFFRDENEWRFVFDLKSFEFRGNINRDSLISFRTKEGNIIPYVSLIVLNNTSEHPTKFPLTKIYKGPTLNKYDSRSIEYLLSKHNLPKVEIKESMIPIR